MNRDEFNRLTATKSLTHAFFTALRQGVCRAQAEIWVLQSPKANPRMYFEILKAQAGDVHLNTPAN